MAKLPFGYRYGFLIILGLLALLMIYGVFTKYSKFKSIYTDKEISEQIKENARFSTYTMDANTMKVDGIYYVIDKIVGDSAFCKTVTTKADGEIADFQNSPDNWNTKDLPVKIFSARNLKYKEIVEYAKDGKRSPSNYRVSAVFK